ncbi:Mn-containing catalase [Citreimonas salinaria]|uniref:Mn-containing catalase n=1 Tax=Citreimonas salinaria TaxID=321339 RepID=A0A1H3KNK2_9RHOB|nr:Mn-containing catalase [Citreimonas salinaria]
MVMPKCPVETGASSDPVYAKKLQEVLGGQWGEISVMMTYLFQGWNFRAPQKYRDMILDIGTEEIAHVEMLATMIARLLESSPVEAREEAAKNSAVGAIMGGSRLEDVLVAGMNPQHAIVSGSGATPTDSVGYP